MAANIRASSSQRQCFFFKWLLCPVHAAQFKLVWAYAYDFQLLINLNKCLRACLTKDCYYVSQHATENETLLASGYKKNAEEN